MSDFLSRLAARAVGETPRARPTLASPPVEIAVEPSTAVAPLATEAPVARATPAAPVVRSEQPESRAAEPATRDTVVEQRTVVRDVVVAPPQSGEAAEARNEPESTPDSTSVHERAAETVPAAPAAATAVSKHVIESRIDRTNTIAAAVEQEPPVRVHSGRLEVRANLQQAPPPPPKPRAEPARSEGLSLGEYLRGRRSA